MSIQLDKIEPLQDFANKSIDPYTFKSLEISLHPHKELSAFSRCIVFFYNFLYMKVSNTRFPGYNHDLRSYNRISTANICTFIKMLEEIIPALGAKIR